MVTPGKNLWHCLGACQAGGSVIDWVMRTERVSFRHAVELLRNRPGGGDATQSASAVSLTPLVSSVTEAQTLDDATLVREVLEFYHHTHGESGSDRVSGTPWAQFSGTDRALSAGLCESHARVPTARDLAQSGRGSTRPA